MDVKIVSSKVLWKKDDDSLKLYEVGFECQGKIYTAKTWSKTLGDGEGKTFDVEKEMRPNKREPDKMDTFIKQVKSGKFAYSAGRQELDKKLASLVCAKDLAIARFGKGAELDVGKMLNESDAILKWLNK
ncbi:hypothetical protein H8E88_35640 [candidate division KSB1 bacterium]|nr:hypothetical protein [candidate division KSB1 bacterium]